MQSQQKRVKWSRGETAEALEERTDTGITNASVQFMENCIPDIYGNLSRRPALKPLQNNITTGLYYSAFQYDPYLQAFPFYITEKDFILVGIHYNQVPEFIRIKDDVIVSRATVSVLSYPTTKATIDTLGTYIYRPVSFAQQNNYMLIADGNNVYKLQIALSQNDFTFTPTLEVWKFSAGWYAPNGTQTKQVSTINNQLLKFDSASVHPYVYTDNIPVTTKYSSICVGIFGTETNLEAIKAEIPLGSIVQFPNSGAYMRVEGYYGNIIPFAGTTFDGVLNPGDTIPATGKYCKIDSSTGDTISMIENGIAVGKYSMGYNENSTHIITVIVKNSASSSEYSYTLFNTSSSTHFTSWTVNGGTPETQSTSMWMFGSFLTPIADDNAIDNIVTVEYGYTSLQPSTWASDQNYPHPKKLVFEDQRLWAGAWTYSATEEYALTIGSQIARYNDFKNDYNQDNEPITLDILTQFQERILHLVDYNGLKIMTESYEYAYIGGKIVKQSANGSLETCEPIVFDSICLYVDSTGCQVKAMEYEFQANIFNSSTINQLTPHDLVWYPFVMASYEDKIHSTGKYLFLINKESTNNPRIAVCNFVPSNQATIWSRWKTACDFTGYYSETGPLIQSIVNMKNEVIFLLAANRRDGGFPGHTGSNVLIPCIMDFEGNVDLQGEVYTVGTTNYYTIIKKTSDGFMYLTLANATIAIYSNGEFQFNTTTDNLGAIQDDLTGLENITAGLQIDSKIISHPIDVQGKTKSIKKRIGKTVLSVHDTEPGAIIINNKTGYMNPQKDKINFYGVTGMKDEIKYTLTNKNGAMFHLESLLMNIEYGTLIS